jgi:hydroxymethylpyrimidine pyrophosphatase-like HAD family hydrolase
VWKFALTDEDIPKLQRLPNMWADAGSGVRMVVARSGGYCPRGNSKGKRLAQWVEAQGLSMQDVVAFGDNYNDLSMLEAAGTGVAMGNAVDEVKARANVVIGENETTSIADFIYRNLL